MRTIFTLSDHRLGQVGLALSFVLLAACGSDTTGPTINNSVSYWQLQLNHHAVTLALTAPYDTIQLTATPLNAAGTPVVDTGATTYSVASTKVHVDTNGVLHADGVVSNLKVYASRTIMGVTWKDSVLVTVTAVTTIPVLRSLTLSGSLTSCPVDNILCLGRMTATVEDTLGATISPVAVAFSSGDAILERALTDNIVRVTATATAMTVRPMNIGQVMLYAEATVYGRTQRDSLLFTVGGVDFKCVYVRPLLQVGHTTPIGTFDPGTVTIGAGGTVMWVNTFTGHTADVVFDNPTAVQPADSATLVNATLRVLRTCQQYNNIIPNDGIGGSIPAWQAVDSTLNNDGIGVRARVFPTPGAYAYHSAQYGTSGTVIVLPH